MERLERCLDATDEEGTLAGVERGVPDGTGPWGRKNRKQMQPCPYEDEDVEAEENWPVSASEKQHIARRLVHLANALITE